MELLPTTLRNLFPNFCVANFIKVISLPSQNSNNLPLVEIARSSRTDSKDENFLN